MLALLLVGGAVADQHQKVYSFTAREAAERSNGALKQRWARYRDTGLILPIPRTKGPSHREGATLKVETRSGVI